MNNNIKKMLRITDNHLDLTSTEGANINGRNTLIIKGTYSPMPLACKNCRSAVIDNDGKTGELVDILPSRTLNKLTIYFNRTPLEERKKVKFLVTDMNYAYFQLTKRGFPTANIIIDRFHVIKHLNTAFN